MRVIVDRMNNELTTFKVNIGAAHHSLHHNLPPQQLSFRMQTLTTLPSLVMALLLSVRQARRVSSSKAIFRPFSADAVRQRGSKHHIFLPRHPRISVPLLNLRGGSDADRLSDALSREFCASPEYVTLSDPAPGSRKSFLLLSQRMYLTHI
jgi:hypothetical protein